MLIGLLSVVEGRERAQTLTRSWPVVIAAASLVLAGSTGIASKVAWSPSHYCWQHSFLELITLNASIFIFLVGWCAGTERQTLRGLVLSMIFLIAGLLSLLHVLSLPGMPAFITPNTLNKVLLFGYASRLIVPLGLLWAAGLPIRRIRNTTRWFSLCLSLSIVIGITILILLYEPSLSRYLTLEPRFRRMQLTVGLTIIALLVVLLFWRRSAPIYQMFQNRSRRNVINALCIWIISEISFMSMRTCGDMYDVLGHIYRFIAYSHICRSLLISSTRRSERRLRKVRHSMRKTRHFRLLGGLAGSLAHELKNPLATIRASAQLCGILDDPITRHQLTKRIEDEVDRLSELISMTAEMGWGRPKTWDLLDMEEIILEIVALWSAELEESGIITRLEMGDGLPRIQACRNLIYRALTNIVLNAVEAMPLGGDLTILVGLDKGAKSVKVVIGDTGPGIPDEIKDHLFKEALTTKAKGTGLGLMITHQIIAEVHKGRITFETEKGKGTKFILRLPITQAEDDSQAAVGMI